MTADIRRLIAPRSIALIGSAAWTDAVAAGNRAVGYRGEIWRVHPTRKPTAAFGYYRSVADLPQAPDAAFIAVPNYEVPGVAAALAARGAGGFVCFSSGFSETGEDQGRTLTENLIDSAGPLPFFGPNCYGFVNFFDRAALLPDQVVGTCHERGIALICQSGTIALTLMFSDRSLPIGCLFTVGNQTCLAVEDLIETLSADSRVTAFGLYLEGIKNAPAFARAAEKARDAGKPIVLVKSGRTAAAARTARSHTGALAGADSVFDAFCRQAGIARVDTLSSLCETLKVLHVDGPLRGRRVLIMGASGGDMAMTADVSRNLNLDFAKLPMDTARTLDELLDHRVTLDNPLDLHTYLWFDPPALGRVFKAAMRANYDAVGFMLDCPPDGKSDSLAFDGVIDEFIAAAAASTGTVTLISSLPETLNSRTRQRCLDGGVVPLQGQREALEALCAASNIGLAWAQDEMVRLQVPPAMINRDDHRVRTLSEAEGKLALSAVDVTIPRGTVVAPSLVASTATALGFPVVIKAVGAGLEHKSEVGGVILDVRGVAEAVKAAARLDRIANSLLVEEMIQDGVLEVLVGITVDPHFGQVLVLGAGGVLAEFLSDTVSLLPPWTLRSIGAGLDRMNAARLLTGHRGKPAGDRNALIHTILGVARYATAHLSTLVELDVNPVVVRPLGCGAVAVDAMIRLVTID